jgi:hypothetical protein
VCKVVGIFNTVTLRVNYGIKVTSGDFLNNLCFQVFFMILMGFFFSSFNEHNILAMHQKSQNRYIKLVQSKGLNKGCAVPLSGVSEMIGYSYFQKIYKS